MDVWTLNEKLKDVNADMNSIVRRLKHIEDYLGKLNSKLELINKVSNETVQDKKDKPSSVRTRRSTTKKSKSSK